jgi:hypothetical protein
MLVGSGKLSAYSAVARSELVPCFWSKPLWNWFLEHYELELGNSKRVTR